MRRFILVGLLVLVVSSESRAFGVPTPPPTPVPPYGSPSPFPTALHTPQPTDRPPRVSAASAVLVDLDSGEVLYERAAGRRRPIASTTKIMTALLVLESATPFDEVIASDEAASQEGAELGLEPGERIPVRELLYALMLQSANDAAVSLAEHVGGSVEAFVEQMNERARTLGLADTRFASPNGLDDSGYSTARDLAAVTVVAFGSSTFGETVGARFRTIPAPEGPARRIQNRNALLWLYPGAIGVKTGYTAAAGFCLVAAAERDGLRLGTVVLGSPREPFSDAAALLNYGFAAYELQTVVRAGGLLPPQINLNVGGREIPMTADESLQVLVSQKDDIEMEFRLADFSGPPMKKGQYMGELVVSLDGQELGSVRVVTREAVPALPPQSVDPRPWWQRAWDAITSFLADAFGPVLEGRSL
jgi:serine-type D-Ala-D-Ala carboxypeptidase (penicillin-binding protein 5/6)